MPPEEGARDGAGVQADLRAVIERAKDPRAVLGLAPAAGAVEARAAFHALCKRYHPARFARSSAETVRLANEAFLAIKRAYDGLIRPEPARVTTEIPPTKPPRAPTAVAAAKPGDRPERTDRIDKEKLGDKLGERPAEKPTEKMPVVPRPPPASEKLTERMPAFARPPGMPPIERSTERATERSPAQRPLPGVAPAPAASAPQEKSEEQRFVGALDLLRRRLWKDAEKVLGELAVSVPSERKYRAYRHYARGRVAQDDGRLDEARTEWERALRLDPDLAAARAAIDSLPEPPKPSGGLLSKLFKR